MISDLFALLVCAGLAFIAFLVYCMFRALVYMFGDNEDDEDGNGWD